MEKKIELKIMQCPTCGADLKVEKPGEAVACVYCGNEIVPVVSSSSEMNRDGLGMSVRVEGLKTPASALAYLDLFFDDFDWDSFVISNTSAIRDIEKIADRLKTSSADDKNTWIFCLKAICRTYSERVLRSAKLIDGIVKKYKDDNLDAYSDFDAYKRIVKSLKREYPTVAALRKKYLVYAEKYGAQADEIAQLEATYTVTDPAVCLKDYADIKDIPAIAEHIKNKNAAIAGELAMQGIHAQQEYETALACINEGEYVKALNILIMLNGYEDSLRLIGKIDRVFSISDIWEIEGVRYRLITEESKRGKVQTYALYPFADGELADRPIVRKMTSIITNYADILYYFDVNMKIRAFDLKNKTDKLIDKKSFTEKSLTVSEDRRKVFILHVKENETLKSFYELDLANGTLTLLKERIKEICFNQDGKFTIKESVKTDKSSAKTVLSVFCVDTKQTYEIDDAKSEVCGYIDNAVVYTKPNPNKHNKSLYIKQLRENSPRVLLESNILDFCNIIAGKIYYYIGNNRNRILININPDKTQRKEISLYLKSVLFEQGGWIYFIRQSGYNTVICRSRTDGSRTGVVCSDIEEFIRYEDGYLYYINSASCLMKVRMDGSNLQTLCTRVKDVLSIDDEKVIYISADAAVNNQNEVAATTTSRAVSSIYVTDTAVGGRMKLAYDVFRAKEYDEDYIYYIEKGKAGSQRTLYRLSVKTYESEKVLTYTETAPSGGCYVATSVYGSYDCPQVWVLRRFRDDVLALTWYGRLFIYLYYAISPTIVKLFGKTTLFRAFWKCRLDKMVHSLREKGFENTPYNDKNWQTGR